MRQCKFLACKEARVRNLNLLTFLRPSKDLAFLCLIVSYSFVLWIKVNALVFKICNEIDYIALICVNVMNYGCDYDY